MGIYLRRKTYWARWTEGGQQRRESLQTDDLAEAQRRFRELAEEASPGRAARTPSGPVLPDFTMRQVLAEWLKFKRARSKPKSIEPPVNPERFTTCSSRSSDNGLRLKTHWCVSIEIRRRPGINLGWANSCGAG